jgi:hypothetical protein
MEPRPAQPTQPTTNSSELLRYSEFVELVEPRLKGVTPASTPFDIGSSALLRFDGTAVICSRGDLWIGSPDAPEPARALATAPQEQVHLVRDEPLFAWWVAQPGSAARPALLSRKSSGQIYAQFGNEKLFIDNPPDDLSGAFAWQNRAVIPAGGEVLMISADPKLSLSRHRLTDEDSAITRALPDVRGLLAWAVSTGTSKTAVWRYLEGEWANLSASRGWPANPLYCAPLMDGSALIVFLDTSEQVSAAVFALETAPIDLRKVETLVDQLSDEREDVRQAAFDALAQAGPGVVPHLQRLAPGQPLETQARIELLARKSLTPALGPMELRPGPVTTLPLSDGGLLLHLLEGVSAERNAEAVTIAPAWVALRPGRLFERLPLMLADALDDPANRLDALASDEWLVVNPENGVRRFIGNHFQPLLPPQPGQTVTPLGADRMGRWIFRLSGGDKSTQTIILDPTYPDPTPRLPVWAIAETDGQVGRVSTGYPARKSGDVWVLDQTRWRQPAIGEEFQPLAGPGVTPAEPKTPSTRPGDGLEPLLSCEDGTRFVGGLDALTVLDRDGRERSWTLPEAHRATDGRPWLVRSPGGHAFLMNRPGQLLRFKLPEGANQVVVEAVFTRGIPAGDIRDLWIDPAGRLCIVSGEPLLSICFPDAPPPAEIRNMMPSDSGTP